MQTGFAFGLFAIFSIIRYRTRQIPIKEMTFLFISIIIATINSTVTLKIGLPTVLIADMAILLFCLILEVGWKKNHPEHSTIKLVYNRLDLLSPEKSELLKEDLEKQLGFNIISSSIETIDFTKDQALMKIQYSKE